MVLEPDEKKVTLSADQIGDLVRDAFYEGLRDTKRDLYVTEDDCFWAWRNSQSRRQMMVAVGEGGSE